MTLTELFPDEDYRFHLGLQRGDGAEFFRPTPRHDSLISERRHWLQSDPKTYAALLPEGIPLLQDAIAFASITGAQVIELNMKGSRSFNEAWDHCLALGKIWEPDFLLLKADRLGTVRLFGGCVCFPSSWKLEEKIGQPIEAIHGVVPGLNPAIGRQIHLFLTKLRPGQSSLRANWGLSRSPELNQHPSRNLARLTPDTTPEEVWLRIEHQVLMGLNDSQGILFGIRLSIHRLTEIRESRQLASRLARALRTMPEQVAEYKGFASARARITHWLTA